ncbi:MAG: hypothetical protein M0R80_04060 [Proteobacteria bacterium]|jgi:hypothetical protein|nr:hypothetical protein [Pseudomonadota bacterium]
MKDNFSTLESAMREHVNLMTKDVKSLFVTSADRDTLWNLYLSSFPKGTNEIVKTRTEHDCSSCRHFVKQFGNAVSIKNGVITTIWDFDLPQDSRYAPVVEALAEYVNSQPVIDIATIDSSQIGVEKNFEKTENGDIITWGHLHIKIPARLVNCSRATAATVRGRASELRGVFKRSLDEITEDSVLSVLELISQNSLYKGEEWKGVLTEFGKHQANYDLLSPGGKEIYTWEQSVLAGPVVGKIRNHSIGVLLIDLSKGVDLDEAVRKYEAIVAPTNYKRPKAIVTPRMIESAEKQITELGYLDSLGRRHATLGDISINDILFANRDVTKKLGGTNPFSDLKKEVPVKVKNFDRVEEVSIDTFVSEILPTASNIEILLENKHGSNLVSLIAPINKDSPSMFKWNNPFSWAYRGNIADSMKQRVKALGGDVTGVLRFSIQWNTEGDNQNDFDAHCIEPGRNEIYFARKRGHPSSGELDVDIISPRTQTKDGIAVENITWSNKSKMPEGTYIFYVHNYSHNGGRSGFTAEIEFNGQIYSFAYNKELRHGEKVQVAEVTYSKKTGQFTLTEKIPFSFASRNLWGLDTNQFQPVQAIMYSPNHWNNQEGIGNKHYFFMLKGCKNEEQPNGFFNEYLKEDLLVHKRVFEALGSKMRVAPSEDQLSGLGFSSTQRNELVVHVEGHVNRVIKVVF